MSNSIVITLPHRLGAEEAKRRIAGGIELLRRNYLDKLAYSEANWNGDTANLRVVAFGQTATAQVYVMNDALRIEVQLPWICRLDRKNLRRSQDQRGRIAADRVYPAKNLNGMANGKEVRANFVWRPLFDSDHHIGGFDDRIGFCAFFETEFLDRFVGDRRDYGFAAFQFDFDMRGGRTLANFLDLAFEEIACGYFHFIFSSRY